MKLVTEQATHHSVLGESGDVGQVANAALDVGLEDVAEVGQRASAVSDHGQDTITAQERLHVAVNGADERLVGSNVQFTAQKRLPSAYRKNSIIIRTIFTIITPLKVPVRTIHLN